jgi:hypothetical protein
MQETSQRRNILIALTVLIVIAALFLLTRCLPEKAAAPAEGIEAVPPSAPVATPAPATPDPSPPAAPEPEEALGEATLRAPERVAAGAAFSVEWTGPNNPGDYIAIVKPDAAADAVGHYRETREGATLELTAPIEAGAHEIRYVTGRSRTVLGRIAVEVEPVGAALEAPTKVVLGSEFAVSWTGPNNTGDYVTIVAAGAADEHYGSYVETEKGSTVMLTAPTVTGDAEVRYVSGQGRKVLARRPIRVIAAEVSLSAPAEAVAGTMIEVAWTGPDNEGDYITVVPAGTPDGQYDNYTDTSRGSPLPLLMPIEAGDAELRYMTGQGDRVLARRAIKIIAARVELSAPAEVVAGEDVTVTWTGPDNEGDYITIVAMGASDDAYGDYRNTSQGSPVSVKTPTVPGEAEIRYVAGQDGKVLARIPLRLVR